MGWLLPKPVQDEAIPLILGGGDVMVAAETGSGKTGAFALPILQIVYETMRGEAGTRHAHDEYKQELPTVQLSATEHDPYFEIIDNHNTTCQSRANWQGGRANVGVKKGKYYFEVTIINGLARMGWCTNGHSPISVGSDQQAYGYGGTGKKAFNGQFTNYGYEMRNSDVVGCMIDLNKREISYSLNGEFLGVAFNNVRSDIAWYPCATVKNGSLVESFTFISFLNILAQIFGCHFWCPFSFLFVLLLYITISNSTLVVQILNTYHKDTLVCKKLKLVTHQLDL